jgi:alginate lyase
MLGLALTVLLAGSCDGTDATRLERERQEREQARAKRLAEQTPPPPRTRPDAGTEGIWISPAELQRLPMSGAAWERLKAAADGLLGEADIADQDSNHDVRTLAVALVYARTGEESYRAKAADAIESAVGTEDGGRTLALGRNLLSYVIAADLIDLRSYDPAREATFRDWLEGVRREPFGDGSGPGTLISTAESSMSNWGGMAGASRVAVAAYLDDQQDLARAAKVMKGWLGDRTAYPGIPGPLFEHDDIGRGFRAGGAEDDLSWQAEPERPLGVNPAGATRDGHSIDGALPDDMRRGGPFQWPPVYTQYPREALSGFVALAEILHRQGYDVYAWENQALLRAARFLFDLEEQFPEEEWWEPGVPVYWIINNRYGTFFPVGENTVQRNVGWTDWTHAHG